MRGIEREIIGFHLDDEQHWVAQLVCGHNQHVRHDPPWQSRPWVITEHGREQALGSILACVKCASGEPADARPSCTHD